MNRVITEFILLIVFASTLFAAKKPDWIEKYPISSIYYIGIGVAQKEKDTRDYIQKAKNNALKEIASEITITISSEVINKIVEKSGVLEEDFKSLIRSTTEAQLEGYELIDTWEDEKEYWVYYRLSKALYEEKKKEKINKAISLSLDLFSKAKINLKDRNIEKALLFYLQSLNPIADYIGETLETNFQDTTIFLENEIYFSLQNILGNSELHPLTKELNAKIGQAVKKPVEVSAVYFDQNGNEIKINNLPITFSFIRGSGELMKNIRTDKNGVGRCKISKISSPDKFQIVQIELDISSLLPQDSTSIIYRDIIKSLPIPNAKIILNVSGLSIFVDAHELNFGKQIDVPYIEPEVKEILSENGFIFVDEIHDADFMLKINAQSREGSKVYNMYSAFVDVTVSVIDVFSGDEINKISLSNIKGIDLDNNKAGLKAFENAAQKVSKEILPILLP